MGVKREKIEGGGRGKRKEEGDRYLFVVSVKREKEWERERRVTERRGWENIADKITLVRIALI